jgi:hypothetical protein
MEAACQCEELQSSKGSPLIFLLLLQISINRHHLWERQLEDLCVVEVARYEMDGKNGNLKNAFIRKEVGDTLLKA